MNKTTSIIPLLALVLLIPPGLVNAQQEASYEAIRVTDAIKAISPYVILDENGFAQLTVDVKDIPMQPQLLGIALDYIAMQTSYQTQINDNPDEKPTISREHTEKFEKFFADIQDKKEKTTKNFDRLDGWDWLLPEAFAWGEVCGGAPWNPQPEPDVFLRYSSLGASNYLVYNGYHVVAFYATTAYGNDYAKETNAFGCNNGEMRMQGLVQTTNTYNSQGPEPNPEIHSYTAPIWWWDGYVIAWHLVN